jgi:acyl carrier protein
MDREQVLKVLREAAVEVLGVDAEQVTLEASFKDDLDADSLDLVELVMALEGELDVKIEEEELEGITTVGAAVDLVMTKVGASA